MLVQYLSHNEINKQRWDTSISRAENGLIYAESFYLDTMCPQWDALVNEDYSLVMPLPWRKKYGFCYLFQPFLTPQSGLFGNLFSDKITKEFLQTVPKKFRLLDISLNFANPVPSSFKTLTRNNYILPITDSYNNIANDYQENAKRNIAKAIKSGCRVEKNIPVSAVIDICKREYPKFTKTEPGLFEQLETVYRHYHQLERAKTYGVYINDQLISVAAFLFSNGRAYYWLVSNEAESRNYGSSYLLVDTFIQEHAGQQLILDFEGSDNRGVADFYKKFGAFNQPYHTIYINRLPFPFNLLKPLPETYKELRVS